MLGEIDKDWYCSAVFLDGEKCCLTNRYCVGHSGNGCCARLHRKYPTPEQYTEEYGVVYPDDGAVYVVFHGTKEWLIYDYGTAKRFNVKIEPVACACTPWGKPPEDWRVKP